MTLFALVGLALVACSHAFAGSAVRHPGTGERVVVTSLLSAPGLRRILTEAVSNFASYPPLATVLVVLIGVGIAERAGLVEALLRRVVAAVPPRLVTAAVVFAGVNASLAADAGIVVLPPLAALTFQRLGRHPLAGLAAAFAGVSGGFSANLFVTSLDPLLAGITQTAARLVTPTYEVAATANYYFMVAATFVLTLAGSIVTERVVEPRLGVPPEAPAGTDTPVAEGPALRIALAAMLAFGVVVALLAVPEGAPLRAPDGSRKPFFDSIVVLTSLGFGLSGIVYGRFAGSVRSDRDAARMASETLGTMGGYLLVAFAAAQVIAWLSWTNLGLVIAVKGAGALRASHLPPGALLAAFMVGCGALDLLVASASAKWALLSPIAVPMLMLLGVSPEVTQAAYRVTDSTTNIVTPLMPYFPAILTFARRHQPEAGVGTLIALMLPYSIAFAIAWSLLFGTFVGLDLPFGPGVRAAYSPG